MMEAVRTSETSVDNNFTQQYIPEDNSEHHTSRRENLKSHISVFVCEISLQPTGKSRADLRCDLLVIIVNTLLLSQFLSLSHQKILR
jgi:hypothetical protein